MTKQIMKSKENINYERNQKLTVSNDHYVIPSRNEFHRYYGGVLTNEDFCTDHPTGKMIEKIVNAIVATETNNYSNFALREDD